MPRPFVPCTCGRLVRNNTGRCRECYYAQQRQAARERGEVTRSKPRDRCACGRLKLAASAQCTTCHTAAARPAAVTRDAATARAAELGYASLDAFWRDHERDSGQECAIALRVPVRWVRANRPTRDRSQWAQPGPKATRPRPRPRDLCACGAPKQARSQRCATCARPPASLSKVDALAAALRRDGRPDEDKVDARLTLLKLLWRRASRRKKAS